MLSVLTETHTSVHDAGDPGQVGREVPWIGENFYKVLCCHGLVKSPSAFCVDRDP